jgi:hypothetical protein
MKNVYDVLRQKELEVSRLEKEVEALPVAAPLLADGEAEDHNQPTSLSSPVQQPIENLQANDTPQQARSAAWGDRAKRWLGQTAH